MKSYIETNLQPCLESSDSDLQAKKNSFQKKLEKKFQYEARKTRSVQMKTLSELAWGRASPGPLLAVYRYKVLAGSVQGVAVSGTRCDKIMYKV